MGVMIKAGIMSMQRIANYGSFLQAYGLKSILEELGCSVQFVDYHPGRTLIPSDGGTGFKRKISKVLEVFQYRAPLKEKLKFIKYKKNYASNYYPYLGLSAGMNYSPALDVLVIGSDEVFNCVQSNANVGFSPELFGEGNRAKKLISYAASFGNTTEEKLRTYGVADRVGGWLRNFDAVSVRDRNSGAVVEAVSGVHPVYHLDPVLAYDFIGKCADIPASVPEEHYMILYGYSGRFSKEECRCIKSYAKEKGLKIFCIGGVQDVCDQFIDCDPFQVIAYFQHAACVVTDTFHGTILSVITHRQFVSLVRNTGYGNSEKLTDLLQRLGLTGKIVKDIQEMSAQLSEKIDFDAADAVIRHERERSYAYLKEQLDSIAAGVDQMDREIPVLFQDKAECCACGACLNICPKQAISMREDEYGFLYPRIDESVCVRCGRCRTVCAFQQSKIENEPLETFAAVATDEKVLKNSASGGVFAAMAGKMIADGGAAVGAALQEDFSVKHEFAKTQAALRRLQGSKYSQSSIGRNYQLVREQLLNGEKVLFSGTPCQIDGLYGYLGKDFDTLVTVDIICHGVPNNKMLQDYIALLSRKHGGAVSAFLFRDKSVGWGKNGSVTVNGKMHQLWQSSSSYLYYFSQGWIFRDSCYQCKYSCEHRPADITIGDFWGIEKQHPEYLGKHGWDESKGISVVIANTQKGKTFLKTMDGMIAFKPSEFEKAAAGNGHLKGPGTPGKRASVLETYRDGGWDALENRFSQNIGWRYYTSRIKSLVPGKLKRWLKRI